MQKPGTQYNFIRRRISAVLLLLLAPVSQAVWAQGLQVSISGLESDIAPHIQSALSASQFQGIERISSRRVRALAEQAREEAARALRPFGYYQAQASTELSRSDDGGWQLQVAVDPGPPTLVETLDIKILGQGESNREFQTWLSRWPLPLGSRLDHRSYEQAKAALLAAAPEQGYFSATYEASEIQVSSSRNQARIKLHFNTGPGASLGQVSLNQEVVQPWVLERLVPFQQGAPYNLKSIDKLRNNLIESGYFQRVDINETRHLDGSPPMVDLEVQLQPRKPNNYQASIGFGSDTGARLQLGWKRYHLSDRGDSLNLVFGLQQQDSEFEIRGDYLRPWGQVPGRFLFASGVLRSESDSFNFNRDSDSEAVFPGYKATRNLAEFRLGTLHQRNLSFSSQPVFERLFVSLLQEEFDTSTTSPEAGEAFLVRQQHPELEPFLNLSQTSVALGGRWDWINIRGQAFNTHGIHILSQVLMGNEAIGSELDFNQAYLNARASWLLNDRFKLLVRGEIGYTDARVTNVDVALGEKAVQLSLTSLPEQYRFKAGGDRSVRGYGFEQLSNNQNGSNHLLTASSELEYRLAKDWSLAAFIDIGNAFNDYADPELKTGVGLGVRWYSVVGPIRLDLAKALDEEGEPLRLHITLGTPLL